MKKIILTIMLTLASSHAMADIGINDMKDGQIISISGWKDLMPRIIDPSIPNTGATEDHLTIKFVAVSGGCTNAGSFKVELKKLNADSYVATAVRTQQDFCEAVSHLVILEKTVVAPVEIFDTTGTRKARVLVEPNVSIGVAY